MRYLLSFIVLIGFAISCEPELDGEVDIIGKWLVLGGCDSCFIFEFNNEDKLLIHDKFEDKPSLYNYKFFRNNTIQIDYGKRNDKYDIITNSIDTIEIVGFTIFDIPEIRSTILTRIYE